MQALDFSNKLFTLAANLVNHTSKSIFLTGKAGTGKTTFLRYIKENCPKQMAVVAPTGVAAINANGVTIHSFFQLPFSPFIPDSPVGFTAANDEVSNKHTLLGRLRFTSEKRKVIQELELLVIDEISMVRCDVLDAIDLVLRHVRSRHYERFGGVQLLFIGDMFQLPPVVKEPEWELLAPYYNSPFFFDSRVMRDEPPVYIEFSKIYRQTEEKFIRLLNGVRNNNLDDDELALLHQRYLPAFFNDRPEGYIVLTTHNDKARLINTAALAKLSNKPFLFTAEVEGDFTPSAYPADEALQLKLGAQVMFIKNDVEKNRRYFNGKIGLITALDAEKIAVRCKDEPLDIEVNKERWDNIRYTLNPTSKTLEEDIIGSFSQYPLRLAWAITIHKSQGLTFEKAVIDAGDSFAPGQVYVALSRCTSLNGMVLQSKIRRNSFFTDPRIVQFSNTNKPIDDLQTELEIAKKAYREKLLLQLFDYGKTMAAVSGLTGFLTQNRPSFNEEVYSWIDLLKRKIEAIQRTAEKFQLQLKKIFTTSENEGGFNLLEERVKAGAGHFSKELEAFALILAQSPAFTDSRVHAREYNDLVREILTTASLQKFLVQGFATDYDMDGFHRRKNGFIAPSFSINAYAAGAAEKKNNLKHPELFFELKKQRDAFCAKKDLPIYLVASGKTVEEMATFLPQTLQELEQISGFGKAKIEMYGKQFLAIVQEYCLQKNLCSNIGEKIPKRIRKEKSTLEAPLRSSRKVDTKRETMRLYKEGKSPAEIAAERHLTPQTIEGHLAHFVQLGEIKIDELVSREKFVLIEPLAKDFQGGSLYQLREKLGEDVSFGEIRLVLAAVQLQKGVQNEPRT